MMSSNEKLHDIDLKAEKEQEASSSLTSSLLPYSSQQSEWWFPIWWAHNRMRWSHLSACLRLPVFPACLGARLPSTTIGQALLYTIILLQLPVALYYSLVMESGGEDVVEGSGGLAQVSLLVAFGLGQKQIASVAIYLFGLSFDRMIPFHKIASIIAVAVATLHGWMAYANRFDLDGDSGDAAPDIAAAANAGEPMTLSSVVEWFITGSDNWSGTYLTLAMALLTVTSMFAILRRKTYYFWLLSHILFSVALLVMGIIHFGVSVPLVIAWAADVLYRYAYKAGWRYPHKGTVKQLSETGIVRLSWPKTSSFFYQPGQFVKIGLPFADKLVFHPLSIASAPEVDEDEVVAYVRASGPWTNRLLEYSILSSSNKTSSRDVSSGSPDATKDVRLFVEGPYGSMGIDLYAPERKHVVLCIGGGVGGSTCLSIAKWLLTKDKVAKLRFVWSVREWELVKDALPDALWHNHSASTVAISKPNSKFAPSQLLESTQSVKDEENQRSKRNLNNGRSGRLVETDLYLTSVPADSPPSEKTPTATVFHGKRPQWDQIFEQTRKDAFRLGYSRVSVVCCGPMIEEIQHACRKYSCSDGDDVRVTFDLHEESFEL
ncbi:unnamed protein product [Cylindrotheca closterium]|uniref:FAD-binding FR-type domain-containing protein n=1 Tax=Cylindrotheca closterium TaxID=2856 RepID=A0AAD2FQM9_9STRA|nr:unnamed protein product [Cylindrotheca closterium]